MDSSLEQVGTEAVGDADTLSTDVVAELTSSLQLTQCELRACRDCYDEALNQLAKLTVVTTKQSADETRILHSRIYLSQSCTESTV